MTGNSWLWNQGTEQDWTEAWKKYERKLGRGRQSVRALDRCMEELREEDVERMSVLEFYKFLRDKYFPWEFKQYLKKRQDDLARYVEEDDLKTLAEIQKNLFYIDHDRIESCLKNVMEIHGLGISGASGLLAVIFPREFGEVNQGVLEQLESIEGIPHGRELSQIRSKTLNVKKAAVLIRILREKAEELNMRFGTNFWTPRKIDMVLWAYENKN